MAPMDWKEETDKMRISFPGNDRGNAVLLSVSLILIFSLVFLSMVPRIIGLKHITQVYKERVLSEIRETNLDIIERYDLY
jgi:hypothetical protein